MGSWQSVHASAPSRVGPLKDASTSEPDHRIPETKKTPYQILPSSGEVNHDAERTCQPGSRNLPRPGDNPEDRRGASDFGFWDRGGVSSPDLDSGRGPWPNSWRSNDRVRFTDRGRLLFACRGHLLHGFFRDRKSASRRARNDRLRDRTRSGSETRQSPACRHPYARLPITISI
jgi:hypothetical protein